jgi:hypothetical protein
VTFISDPSSRPSVCANIFSADQHTIYDLCWLFVWINRSFSRSPERMTHNFERPLKQDIRQAQNSIAIFSSYVTLARAGKRGGLFRQKIAEGIRIRCVTSPPEKRVNSARRRSASTRHTYDLIVD